MRIIALLILLTSYLLPSTALAAGEVEMLWQGETYVPPFYEGRSLWSYQSKVVLTVVPHVGGAPASLYYKWSQDGTVLGSLSGVNKRSLILTDSALSLATSVKVEVLASDMKSLGEAIVSLQPVPWKALIYEDSPLYGTLFNKAVGDKFSLKGEEVSFLAIPYFSTVSTRAAPAIEYTWTTNIGDSRTGNRVTYRVPDEGSGSSSVTFRATNSQIIQLPIVKNFLVEFGNKQNAL